MRRASTLTAALLVAACLGSSAVHAQFDLSSVKIVQPSPELPGDRAMSCATITDEMSEIMRKRGMKEKIASSKSKMCSSKKELDRLGEERKKLSAAQAPGLVSAAVTGGPVANVVTKKTQAEDAALEAKQRPDRDRALATQSSGINDVMSMMNDPRLMRLSMLAQEKQCGASMAPAQNTPTRTQDDLCNDVAEPVAGKAASGASHAASSPAGAADPFAPRGKPAASPAANDPFAKR